MRFTRILQIDAENPQQEILQEATQIIRQGGIIAFPTDTLYGLGSNAMDPQAIQAVYLAKERPSYKPLIILAKDRSMVEEMTVGVSPLAYALMDRFWPGPLTLILHASPNLPSSLTGNTGRVGVRIPGSPVARRLLDVASIPITAPSANRSGGKDPMNAQIVKEELMGRIDLLLDGGPVLGIASTLLDLTICPPRILRQGVIPEGLILSIISGKAV